MKQSCRISFYFLLIILFISLITFSLYFINRFITPFNKLELVNLKNYPQVIANFPKDLAKDIFYYQYEESAMPLYHSYDPILGHVNLKNMQSIAHYLDKDNKTIKEIPPVTYKFDEYGRRIHPTTKNQKNKFAIFLGCSFVMGVALDAHQTMPYIFEQKRPNYRGYNYGVNGYGTHQILKQVQDTKWKKQINEQDGLFIMTSIPQHLYRSTGHSTKIHGRLSDPYFKEDSNGEMVYAGSLLKARPFTTISNYLVNLIPKLANLDNITPDDISYDCKLTIAIRDHIKMVYPKAKFILIPHPFLSSSYYTKQFECYSKHNITTLNLLNDGGMFKLLMAPDRAHPSVISNNILIDLLISKCQTPSGGHCVED